MTRHLRPFASACIAIAGLAWPAAAQTQSQTPPPAQTQTQAQATAGSPPANAGPDTTTATFGDWLMRCGPMPGGKAGARSCEVVQNIILENKTQLAQLAFGRLGPDQPLYFTAVLPNNVTFPSTVRIAIDEKDDQPVQVPWTRCLPAGCFATAATTDAMLKRWRAQDGPGRLTFKNGAGQDTTLPISFRGLARALDALGKN